MKAVLSLNILTSRNTMRIAFETKQRNKMATTPPSSSSSSPFPTPTPKQHPSIFLTFRVLVFNFDNDFSPASQMLCHQSLTFITQHPFFHHIASFCCCLLYAFVCDGQLSLQIFSIRLLWATCGWIPIVVQGDMATLARSLHC